MNWSWRFYAWSLVALVCFALWLTGCSFGRVLPSIPPPSDVESEAPAGAGPAEAAAFYRKKASEYQAAATNAEAEAKKAKLESRQAYLWWAGVSSIILGVVAFALAFAYPLASFLRIAGWAGVGGGVASLLVGEALPYLGLFGMLAVVAIALSLIVNSQALKATIASWKASANAVKPELRASLDEASLNLQNRLVKPFLSQKLRK